MALRALSPNFLIKVPKSAEKERSEKIGEVYLHPSFVWMTRNTQCGIIVSASKEAAKQLPEAKEGDMLIIHHFTQGSMSMNEPDKRFLVHEDDTDNYYNVTSTEYNGQNNQTYGVWNGTTIVPHPDYVFLEIDIITDEELITGSVLTPEWYQTPEDIHDQLEEIKNEIMSLTRTKLTPEIIRAVQQKESEQMRLSRQLHKSEYLRYQIAYSNKSLGIDVGAIVFVKNIAANTTIEFNGKEYRVCEKKYIAAI